jgi:mono/diheme cytochrome c family protein
MTARLGFAAAAALLLSGCALFPTPEQRGRQVAERWCAECHRIAPDEPSGTRAGHILPPPLVAPSFMDVAARPGLDHAQLERFITELHLPMPTFRLDATEQEQVIRYILSLKS